MVLSEYGIIEVCIYRNYHIVIIAGWSVEPESYILYLVVSLLSFKDNGPRSETTEAQITWLNMIKQVQYIILSCLTCSIAFLEIKCIA